MAATMAPGFRALISSALGAPHLEQDVGALERLGMRDDLGTRGLQLRRKTASAHPPRPGRARSRPLRSASSPSRAIPRHAARLPLHGNSDRDHECIRLRLKRLKARRKEVPHRNIRAGPASSLPRNCCACQKRLPRGRLGVSPAQTRKTFMPTSSRTRNTITIFVKSKKPGIGAIVFGCSPWRDVRRKY